MKISVKLTQAAVEHIDRLIALEEEIRFYLPFVNTELEQFHSIKQQDNGHYATRCLLFALASPMNRFESNVIAAQRLHDGLYKFQTIDDVYQALAEGKHGTLASGTVAKAIYYSLDYIREFGLYGGPSGYIGSALRLASNSKKLFGGGPKVTAMAAHLWNKYDFVYTLDTHMLRGIMKYTLDLHGTFEIGEAAYSLLEQAMLKWATEYFPDESAFATQWALWSVFRGDFTSHLGIFRGKS